MNSTMESRSQNAKINMNANGGQFPSTFPETFKDFFAMINEDEDQVEVVSNILEDKVIPRYNVRGRNRSSSAKYSNSTSLLPHSGVGVRSSSFRINRNTSSSGNLPVTGTSEFCKHIKYCCLHQNTNNNSNNSVGRKFMTSEIDHIDRNDRNREICNVSGGPAISGSIGTDFKFIDFNTYSNYSDDEKSKKFTNNKFSADNNNTSNSTINNNANNKSSQQIFDSFDRKCNCENCSATPDFNNRGLGDGLNKAKSANSSSYCLMRYSNSNNHANQLPRGCSDRNSITSGASNNISNMNYNFSSNSSNSAAIQDKIQDSTGFTTTLAPSRELARHQKSPNLARRRSSSITIARNTLPNFGPNQPQATTSTSPVHNQHDLYRYIKSNEQQQQQQQQQQTTPWGHHLTESSAHSSRLDTREKYIRSKSPNMLNRKTIEVSSPAINSKTNVVNKEVQQRARTASMPGENRKPRLAETRRSAIHCADVDMEYYRLRSFSITSHGICNLGDSMKSRRSRSINSVTSSNSGRDRKNSTSSQHMDEIKELDKAKDEEKSAPYKIAMLGDSGVGKTQLTYQFTTSEYICAYDLSLDDDYGQKTVSVLLNNQETDLEIIDHPTCEMSVEAFCSTYNIDLFVIVYSVVERKSFKTAERILLYLKENEMMLTRGVILVGNKTDLERQREISTNAARKLAKEVGCKFIETSSGLDYGVDELLVGIVAQVKLNPQRLNNLSDKQRNSISTTMQQKYKRTTDQLRRNNQRKTNIKKLMEMTPKAGKGKAGKAITLSTNNKENNIPNRDDDFDDESDDERSSNDEDDEEGGCSDIEKYLNLGDMQRTSTHDGGGGESSTTLNLNRLLNCRRYASAGMQSSSHASINPLFNNNNNFSTSSCSTPNSMQTQPNEPIHNANSNRFSYDTSPKPTPKKSSNQSGNDSDSSERCINKFSSRTKLFLTSFLKFKRSLRVKRRNSNSCSDLFVI